VVVDRGQDHYVLAVGAAGGDPARTLVHVKEAFAEQGAEPAVPASALAKLTQMEVGGTLTSTQVKQVLADLVAGDGVDPEAIAAARGFEAVDTSSLETLVDEAIAAQPDAWEKYRAGEDKAVGALVGAVMKASQGQADGKAVTAILRSRRG
ncbi:MAG TPA: Asp-tRNA(Asn)/Glu-tRNA(Gln) amidotransferase subunit GatB, partial [Ilumatobacteraceae bacterium]|nr:Asp-tRNA(Asn)/Glu-tRNA(Gln) amidotransferase subunit GatB [Ilumatobacteraceae bacterium]